MSLLIGMIDVETKALYVFVERIDFPGCAFICVAGTYVIVKLIVDAYNSGCKSLPVFC